MIGGNGNSYGLSLDQMRSSSNSAENSTEE